MEPTTIAIAAVSYIALQIASGGLREIGKDVYGKVKESLKPDELIKLNLLENSPENIELQDEVARVLAKRLEENPAITGELAKLLKQLPASQVKQNTIDIEGDNNIAVQDVSGIVNINK